MGGWKVDDIEENGTTPGVSLTWLSGTRLVAWPDCFIESGNFEEAGIPGHTV